MKHVVNALTTSHVRRSMQHVPSFQLDVNLPRDMLKKLDELDRVVAAREAKAA